MITMKSVKKKEVHLLFFKHEGKRRTAITFKYVWPPIGSRRIYGLEEMLGKIRDW